MEGAGETLNGSAMDAGVAADCNQIFCVADVIGKSATEPADSDFDDDVIVSNKVSHVSSKPLKNGMQVEKVFIKLQSNNGEPNPTDGT